MERLLCFFVFLFSTSFSVPFFCEEQENEEKETKKIKRKRPFSFFLGCLVVALSPNDFSME